MSAKDHNINANENGLPGSEFKLWYKYVYHPQSFVDTYM